MHSLYIRIPDASEHLGYTDMWVSGDVSRSDGMSAIQSPPDNLLRLMESMGAVLKLTDSNGTPVAFSRLARIRNKLKILWISDSEMHDKIDYFGAFNIFYDMTITGKVDRKSQKFLHNFVEHFSLSADPVRMMKFTQGTVWASVKAQLASCDMIELVLNSRKQDERVKSKYMEVLDVIRDVLEDKATHQEAFDLVNKLKVDQGYGAISDAFYNVLAAESGAAMDCYMFSLHTDLSVVGNYRVDMKALADILRNRLTALECMDEFIVPNNELI